MNSNTATATKSVLVNLTIGTGEPKYGVAVILSEMGDYTLVRFADESEYAEPTTVHHSRIH